MDINMLKIEINKWLNDYFKNKGSYNKLLYDSMKYSIEVGGKRIRPILMLSTYSIYKDNYKDIMPMACAIEMIHTYSLIHDDLPGMDNDDLRRGKPTNHKIFGEAIAILAGDGLLNEAMNIMFNYSLDHDKIALMASKVISEAAGAEGMIGGQVVDIISEGQKISIDKLKYMHKNKTGQLIKSSIIAGAILGGACKEEIEILDEFGSKLGLAFQIKDDILDVIGDSKVLGKEVHKDDENNKTTFISCFGLEKCKELCVELTDQCIKLLSSIGKDTKQLENIALFLMKREF
ncbi:polyprenyl synthetase family protein [Clostridium botulinum]|uniref:Farnesyl diphosphate synthase n=1 Tax=Clostridium botulinum C/D str. DC5 TaxID=1443128 RepID=A0A0A0IMR9_CLOBO|nr:farnesyl diphosphate synthase [Clostridium botulinum]KEI07095.1 farnesyl-diphosphate synthase [Clostridium botulinum C/D str. BKT75002]KEI12172.1 farnesyl-diphosphate synthase [Clostridium botulinum C/D str. BKT2873]KGM96857.1 farnesyl-diphosphate synthase [Clostridium botulinum D str. CCUG 7971]KGN01929.1 farnesyl-diphosphate synthase [Clostridium botulinum C/D str. DC5]KOC48566.1 farnesyl-diphosphate synthase [Clostridium botulinum]